jgi:alpha-glucosidase (family GH31 glycosyl hydrolase)
VPRVLTVVLALLLAAPAPAAAADPVAVSAAGAVSFDPAPAGGVLGFTTAAGDARVTGVAGRSTDGDALVLDLATDDPLGRHLRVRVAPAGDGIVALRATPPDGATATRITFDRAPGERFYGFGERSDAVGRHAGTVENYVSDGPFTGNSKDVVRLTIPPQGFRDREDATYYPVPWLLSGRGFGVLLDDDETSTFALGEAGAWTAEVQAAHLDLRVFAGPTPAKALARFTAATGRQPEPDAPWTFGPWLQTGQPNAPPLAEGKADLEKLRAADAPVSAAETQLRYLPCGLDRGNEAYEAERVRYYHEQGLAVLTYVNPMVCASYDPVFSDANAAGGLQKNAAGGPALFNSFVGGTGPAGFTIQPVGQFDFTTPAGDAAYGTIVRKMLDAGHDGWMEDFGEYTPLDVVSADGTPGPAMHNRYPTTYHCGVRRILAGRRVVRFQRSGWTGAAACASDVWGGDPTTQFGFDGLASAVKQALSIGLSGVSRWGSDIGGYDTLGDDPQLTPELLRRWIEFGAVSGVMRIKKSGLALPAYARPQIWDPDVVPTWRRYAKLHTQLYPYLVAADRAYRRTGIPLMRALVLGWPGDERAAAAEDEFGFGPDLLAAPVVTDGARSREVYLPRGRWLDGAAALRYVRRTGGHHAGRARSIAGGRTVTAAAPLDRLPLFVRAGAVLPLLTPDVSTLSDHGKGTVVRLADRAGRLRLLAFPVRGTRRATMYEGERLTSRARRGCWTLRIAGARKRSYTVEASLGLVPGLRRPHRVTLGGRRLRFRYARRTRVLTVTTARVRRGTLTVR